MRSARTVADEEEHELTSQEQPAEQRVRGPVDVASDAVADGLRASMLAVEHLQRLTVWKGTVREAERLLQGNRAGDVRAGRDCLFGRVDAPRAPLLRFAPAPR